MSDSWIKMRTCLLTSPKVIRVSVALGIHPSAVCGACFAVWAIADTHSSNGRLPGYTYTVLDQLAGVPGLCRALETVGWAKEDADGVTLPKYGTHNGSTAKSRATAARRASRKRDRDSQNPSRSRHAATVTKGAPEQEKKREEKNSSSSKSENRAAPAAGLSPELVQSNAEYLRRKPDWLPEGKPWLTNDAVMEFADSWLTGDDVNRVMREARDSRKTLSNPAGFIVKELRAIARKRMAEQAKAQEAMKCG